MTAIAAPVVFIGLLLAAWETACRVLEVPSYFLPAPSAIGAALRDNFPLLAQSGWNTLATALWALLAASIVASLLALAAGLSGLVEQAIHPLVITLSVTPIIAIAPIVTIWAGLEHPERAVVGLAAVVAFFPIFSGVLTGLKSTDPDLERLFDLYGATRWQKLTRLRLPSAAPLILQGHKVAASLAVVGAVVAEFGAGSGGSQGLAWRILEASNRLQTAKAFAALFVLSVMGAGLYALLQVAERRALVWWRGR
ncbi:MAG: ABC transporter permease [Caulobacterales bacterium]|nr:ABC transporter permease [Caulobacterales bacterium]